MKTCPTKLENKENIVDKQKLREMKTVQKKQEIPRKILT